MKEAPRGTKTLFGQCDRALNAWGSGARRWSTWVPGRIEVLGKHTDYAGGRSLLCALERGFCARVSPRRDATLRIFDVAGGTTFETTLTTHASGKAGHWTDYAATVARRVARNFPGRLRGADICFLSDLPSAAGMSSSSALLISVFLAVSKANSLSRRAEYRGSIASTEDLAAYLGAMENGRPFRRLDGGAGVGTMGGNQDQVAILCSQAGALARYGWSPVHRESMIAMPDGYVFALAASGVAAPKTGSAMARYNHASMAVQRLTQAWNTRSRRNDPMLYDAVVSGRGAVNELRDLAATLGNRQFTASFMVARFEQFVHEATEIIPAACDALARGALVEFGLLVDRSQQLVEDKLGNQIPETVALQRQARALGAVAASAFGAGFGGSVWALVPRRGARAFLADWKSAYAKAHPGHTATAQFFLSAPGPPAYWF